MNKSDLISVIIPVYNSSERLDICVNSILNQSYSNLEIVLVDDGSTDNSLEIINSYVKKDSRVKGYHKNNGGVSSTRNYGLKVANGKFISFIDSDDYIDKEYFKTLLKHQKINNSDIVRCGYHLNNKSYSIVNVKEVYVNFEFENKLIFDEMLKTYKFNSVWGQLIKKSVIKEVKFDESLSMGEDFEFNINIIKNSSIVTLIPDVLYYYYYNNNGMNYSKNKKKILKKIFDINSIYSNILNDSCFNANLIQVRYINEIFPHILDIISYKYKDYLKEIKMIRNDSFLSFERKSNNNLKKAKYYLFYKILKKKYFILLFIIGRLTLFIKKFKNYIES